MRTEPRPVLGVQDEVVEIQAQSEREVEAVRREAAAALAEREELAGGMVRSLESTAQRLQNQLQSQVAELHKVVTSPKYDLFTHIMIFPQSGATVRERQGTCRQHPEPERAGPDPAAKCGARRLL